MECLEAYKTIDGNLFEDHQKALAHCENRMGEELDGILKTIPDMGHRMKLNIMKKLMEDQTLKQFQLLARWVNEYHEMKGA